MCHYFWNRLWVLDYPDTVGHLLTRECDSNEWVLAVSGGWNSLVPCLLTMAIVSYCGPEPIRYALVSIFRNSLRKCRSNWNAFWILGSSSVYWPSIQQRIAWQNVQFGSFISNIERRSVGFSEMDELWVLTVWQLFAIACTSKEVIANLLRHFVGVLILGSSDVYQTSIHQRIPW